MKTFAWLSPEIYKVIGWSIIHSLWQFLLLFIALKTILSFINKSNSSARYYISLSILMIGVFCSASTIYREFKVMQVQNPAEYNVSTPSSIIQVSPSGTTYQNVKTIIQPERLTTAFDIINQISPYLTLGWVIGIFICMFQMLKAGLSLHRLRKITTDFSPKTFQKLNELLIKMDIRNMVRLTITDKVDEPFTFGSLKPLILLPASYVAQVPMEQLEMIIAHELAHIKRYDYLINLFQAIIDVVYFFNPFLKAISNLIREEREYCCDDMATNYLGGDRTLAIALTNLKLHTSYPRLALAAAPVKSGFQQRIYRLVSPSPVSKTSVMHSILTFFVFLSLMLVLTKCVQQNKGDANLPTTNQSFTQLYTDNQANHKIDLLNYQKNNQAHEILLISEPYGKPQYAYMDGTLTTDNQFKQICIAVKASHNISAGDIKKTDADSGHNSMHQIMQLNKVIEDLNQNIKSTKQQIKESPSAELSNKLAALNNQVAAKEEEMKKLSMDDFQAQTKNIPEEVALHNLSSKIISTKEYTSSDRERLNELAKKSKGSI
jgi:beta-lactamase regulating signal transducer with metallopeptidase domain